MLSYDLLANLLYSLLSIKPLKFRKQQLNSAVTNISDKKVFNSSLPLFWVIKFPAIISEVVTPKPIGTLTFIIDIFFRLIIHDINVAIIAYTYIPSVLYFFDNTSNDI